MLHIPERTDSDTTTESEEDTFQRGDSIGIVERASTPILMSRCICAAGRFSRVSRWLMRLMGSSTRITPTPS